MAVSFIWFFWVSEKLCIADNECMVSGIGRIYFLGSAQGEEDQWNEHYSLWISVYWTTVSGILSRQKCIQRSMGYEIIECITEACADIGA
jgi:hypothetical protein